MARAAQRQARRVHASILRERTQELRTLVPDGQMTDFEKRSSSGVDPTGAEPPGNRIEVLTDGNDVYEALGAAIDQAEHHINAEFYLIRNDATGAWFRDKLVRAAERGVAVRLLCDAYGCLAIGGAWRRPLRRAGAKLGIFLPMRSLFLQRSTSATTARSWSSLQARLLRRSANIGNEYRGQIGGHRTWRDTIFVWGAGCPGLAAGLFQDWFFATGEGVDPTSFFPPRPRAGGQRQRGHVPSGPDTRPKNSSHFLRAIAERASASSSRHRISGRIPPWWSRSKSRPCAASTSNSSSPAAPTTA